MQELGSDHRMFLVAHHRRYRIAPLPRSAPSPSAAPSTTPESSDAPRPCCPLADCLLRLLFAFLCPCCLRSSLFYCFLLTSRFRRPASNSSPRNGKNISDGE